MHTSLTLYSNFIVIVYCVFTVNLELLFIQSVTLARISFKIVIRKH